MLYVVIFVVGVHFSAIPWNQVKKQNAFLRTAVVYSVLFCRYDLVWWNVCITVVGGAMNGEVHGFVVQRVV